MRFAKGLAVFDPYHKWLGIPPGPRPPTHYQLLGIAPDEQDLEVIQEAAIRQTTHLRTYQSGPHTQECTRLLNAIAEARLVLCDPVKRKKYDASLEPQLPAKSQSHTHSRPPSMQLAALESERQPRTVRPRGGKPFPSWGYAAIILGIVLTLGIAAFAMWNNARPNTDQHASLRAGRATLANTPTIPETTRPAKVPPPPTPPESPPPPLEKPPAMASNKPPPPPDASGADSRTDAKPPPPAVMPEKKEPAKRLAVPGAEAQARAEREIKELFKVDYAKSKPPERLALALKLFRQAQETRDAPTDRFVLYREARDTAILAGNVPTTLQIVDSLGQEYAIDVLDAKVSALATIASSQSSPIANRHLAERFLSLVEEAIADDEYEIATKAADLAGTAAQRAQSSVLARFAQSRIESITELQTEFEGLKTKIECLREQPKDGEANLAVGSFYCFRKGQWDIGLPMLVLGNDQILQDLSKRDQANPSEAMARLSVGDAWWEYAEGQPDPITKEIRSRACSWYLNALPGIIGLTRTKLEARLIAAAGQPELKPGLLTELYQGDNLQRKIATRTDSQISANWDAASPDPKIKREHFSVRWTGYLLAPRPGMYVLTVNYDDGARIWLDGELVFDRWKSPLVFRGQVTVFLTDQPHALRVEYWQLTGPAHMILSWSREKGSPEQVIPVVIPMAAFFH
jgi:hypothetical protein